jgi:hypothetical protein
LVGVDYSRVQPVIANKSNGFEKTKIGHLINESNLSGSIELLVRRSTDNQGKILPSREQAEAFDTKYRESNIELNKKFGLSDKIESIFDDDFSSYPELQEDTWDEETANKAIKSILKCFSSSNNFDADTLRDSAVALEV